MLPIMVRISKTTAHHSAALFVMGALIGSFSGMTYGLGFSEGLGGNSMTSGNILNMLFGINPDNQSYYGLLPGVLFGVCVSAVYTYFLNKTRKRWLKAACIIFVCSACYFIARGLLGTLALGPIDITYGHGLMVGVAAFISSLIMMALLKLLTQAYSWKMTLFVDFLGAFSAYLFMLPATTAPLLSRTEAIIFFVGWQSVMLVAVGLPLMQRTVKPKIKI